MAYTALTFVAGEVLTATKMNQLAANDASFNDGTGIGDGVILASHLNPSSFDKYFYSGTGVASTTSGATTWKSYTVANSGVYLAIFTCCLNSGSTASTQRAMLYKGSTALATANQTSYNTYASTTVAAVFTASAGDVVSARVAATGAAGSTYGEWQFACVQIA